MQDWHLSGTWCMKIIAISNITCDIADKLPNLGILFLALGCFVFSLLFGSLLSLSNKTSIAPGLAQSLVLATFLLRLINLTFRDRRSWCWQRKWWKYIRLKTRGIRFLLNQLTIPREIRSITGKVHQQPFSFHPSSHEFYEGIRSTWTCTHSISAHSTPNSPRWYCVSYDPLQYPTFEPSWHGNPPSW